MSDTLYPEDTIVRAVARETSITAATGAIAETALTAGAGTAYLATTRDGAALAGTTLALTESTSGGVYYGTWAKNAIASAMANVADGATVWRVVTFTGAAPVATALLWHTERT